MLPRSAKLITVSLLIVLLVCASIPLTSIDARAEGPSAYTWTVASDGHYGNSINPNGESLNALIPRLVEDGTQRHFDNGDVSDTVNITHYPIVKSMYDSGLGTIPYHMAVGNHDSTAGMMSVFGMQPMYTVTDGDYVWIVLISAIMLAKVSDVQLDYLEAQLELYEDKVCFVLAHVPQKKIQPGISKTDVDNERFISIVETHADHIGAVVFSHVHTPTIQHINGVTYVNTGTYGAPNDNTLGIYGYMLFEIAVDDHEYTITVSYKDIATGLTVPGYSSTYVVNTPYPHDTFFWDGEGADDLASNPVNWRYESDGVVINDAPLTQGASLVWDETATKNCTWDLSGYSALGWYIKTGYKGTITIGNVDIHIGTGGLRQFDGKILWNPNKMVYCAGSALQSGGTSTYDRLNIILSGNGVKVGIPGTVRTLDVRADVKCIRNMDVGTIKTAPGATLTIDGALMRWTSWSTGASYTNLGEITGSGTFQYRLYTKDVTIDPGVVRCKVTVTGGVTADRVLTMTGDAVFGPFAISSENAIYTVAIDIGEHDMTVASIAAGARGVLIGGNGTITNYGDMNTSAGLTRTDNTHYIQAGDGTITLGAGQSFDALTVPKGVTLTLGSDVTARNAHILGTLMWDDQLAQVIEISHPTQALDKFDDFCLHIMPHQSVWVTVYNKPLWLSWNPHTLTLSGKAYQSGTYELNILTEIHGGERAWHNYTLTVAAPPVDPAWSAGDPQTDYGTTMLYIIVAAAIAFIMLVFAFMRRR